VYWHKLLALSFFHASLNAFLLHLFELHQSLDDAQVLKHTQNSKTHHYRQEKAGEVHYN